MAGTTYKFGSGKLIGRRITENGDVTPILLGVLQSVNLTYERELKQLFGENQMPVAVAAGQLTVSVQAEYATINSNVYNELYFGQESTSGYTDYTEEVAVIDADTPTIVVNEAATFDADMGVTSEMGLPYTNVSSKSGAPSAFEYKFDASTGTYTFAAADAGKKIAIRYTYSKTGGKTTELSNELMGVQPEFSMFLYSKFQGNVFGWNLYRCIASNLDMSSANDDFTVPSFSAQAFALDNGKWGNMFSSSTY